MSTFYSFQRISIIWILFLTSIIFLLEFISYRYTRRGGLLYLYVIFNCVVLYGMYLEYSKGKLIRINSNIFEIKNADYHYVLRDEDVAQFLFTKSYDDYKIRLKNGNVLFAIVKPPEEKRIEFYNAVKNIFPHKIRLWDGKYYSYGGMRFEIKNQNSN